MGGEQSTPSTRRRGTSTRRSSGTTGLLTFSSFSSLLSFIAHSLSIQQRPPHPSQAPLRTCDEVLPPHALRSLHLPLFLILLHRFNLLQQRRRLLRLLLRLSLRLGYSDRVDRFVDRGGDGGVPSEGDLGRSGGGRGEDVNLSPS
jgi:hypothetical protein